MANTWGSVFRVTTFGESHGPMVGAVIDGLPARFGLKESDLQPQLDRRRPGQSDLTTPRQETDTVQIISGVEKGMTLGSPVTLVIRNRDTRPEDYGEMRSAPRPSHADFTYMAKYGVLASSGGGRASARETAARVAAGAVAEKFLRERFWDRNCGLGPVGRRDCCARPGCSEIDAAEGGQDAGSMSRQGGGGKHGNADPRGTG